MNAAQDSRQDIVTRRTYLSDFISLRTLRLRHFFDVRLQPASIFGVSIRSDISFLAVDIANFKTHYTPIRPLTRAMMS